ncbi:Transcription factor castor [Schistosoma japonicum]|nr:Transcription factor castor [Schistosoma japonicum]
MRTNTLLFSGLPSTIFNLPSHLTYTNTTFPSKTSITDHCIKESEHVESKELFSKLSNVMNFHYNESFYNHLSLNSNEFYDSTTIMNNLLKPTNLIINNPINYSYNSNEAISTCTSLDETLIKEFDSELSLKPIEQLDMKTASLCLTESDLHSIPNLVESIKKYHSNEECGFDVCRSSKIREHYHCGICNKILLRREEMIRHAKWHRKREESMQHGFMRYSPCDDCTIASCPHNGRQTHYHCMQSNCDKAVFFLKYILGFSIYFLPKICRWLLSLKHRNEYHSMKENGNHESYSIAQFNLCATYFQIYDSYIQKKARKSKQFSFLCPH